jgi:hypothetical protein
VSCGTPGEDKKFIENIGPKPEGKKSPGRPWGRWEQRATGWTIGVLGFDSRRGLGIFLFTTASRTALGPTQPPTQWVPGALSLGVKRPGREAHHSPPSRAEVQE